MNSLLKTTPLLLIALGLAVLGVSWYVFMFNPTQPTDEVRTDGNTNLPSREFKIVAFGDSLTTGLGVDLKDSYPSILETRLNNNPIYKEAGLKFTIINMGVSGETTTGGLERVDFVLAQKPDLILLGLGANDMLRSTDPAIVSSNLTVIIEKIKKSQVPLLLLGMQSAISSGFKYKRDFDSIYPKLAKAYSLPLVPFFLEGVVLVPDLNTADGIHPNRSGYEKIVSENVLPILEPTLKKLIK